MKHDIRYLFFLLTPLLAGCGLVDTDRDVVSYGDIYGNWISTASYFPFTFDENLEPLTYRPKSYYVFTDDAAVLYEEEWSGFSYVTCSWEYFSTKVFAANSVVFSTAGKYSTDEGLEVMTIDWSRYTRAAASNEWIKVYGYSFLQSYVLLSLSANADTLVIGYCDSYDCGGDQFGKTGHYNTDTLVRIDDDDFAALKAGWWYY